MGYSSFPLIFSKLRALKKLPRFSLSQGVAQSPCVAIPSAMPLTASPQYQNPFCNSPSSYSVPSISGDQAEYQAKLLKVEKKALHASNLKANY